MTTATIDVHDPNLTIDDMKSILDRCRQDPMFYINNIVGIRLTPNQTYTLKPSEMTHTL